MKRLTAAILGALLICSAPLRADQDMQIIAEETDELYRQCNGDDGAFTSVAGSMIGWGFVLGIGIGVLCSVLHASTATSH